MFSKEVSSLVFYTQSTFTVISGRRRMLKSAVNLCRSENNARPKSCLLVLTIIVKVGVVTTKTDQNKATQRKKQKWRVTEIGKEKK